MTASEVMKMARANKNDPNRAVIGPEGDSYNFAYRLENLTETRIGENTIYSADPLPKDCVIFGKARRCTVIIGHMKSGLFKIYVNGTDNVVYLGSTKKFQGKIAIEGERNLFFFGDQSTCNFAGFLVAGQDRSVIFGTDCMLSFQISIRNTDSHAIVSLESNSVTNPPESVLIHHHVWVGEGAKVLKGVTIEPGAIVAANATVVANVPARSVAVGLPAKIIEASKGKVSWTRNSNPTVQDIKDVADAVRTRGAMKSLIDTLTFKRRPSLDRLATDELDIEEFAELGAAIGSDHPDM